MIANRAIRPHWVLGAWIGVTALIALNRGVDLLWGLVILSAFAALAAALLPALQVRGLNVRRLSFPASGVVGEPQSVRYEIEARSWLPRYGVEIHDDLNGAARPQLAAFLPRVRGRAEILCKWTPGQRGCWRLRGLVLESRYPLGVLSSRRNIDALEHEVTIYPDYVPMRWLPVRNDDHPRLEQTVSARRGGHDEFFGLRHYAPGDETRSVHWRMSARLGGLVIREFEHQQDRRLWIVLELAESQHVGLGPLGTCEQMIRIAHSAAVKAHAEGVPVGLLYRVADTIHRIEASADRSTYLRIRDALARVNAHAQLPAHTWLPRLREQIPAGGAWLMFHAGDDGQRGLLEKSAAARSAFPLIVEFDRSSHVRQSAAPGASVKTHRTAHSLVSIAPYGADLTELFRP